MKPFRKPNAREMGGHSIFLYWWPESGWQHQWAETYAWDRNSGFLFKSNGISWNQVPWDIDLLVQGWLFDVA